MIRVSWYGKEYQICPMYTKNIWSYDNSSYEALQSQVESERLENLISQLYSLEWLIIA